MNRIPCQSFRFSLWLTSGNLTYSFPVYTSLFFWGFFWVLAWNMNIYFHLLESSFYTRVGVLFGFFIVLLTNELSSSQGLWDKSKYLLLINVVYKTSSFVTNGLQSSSYNIIIDFCSFQIQEGNLYWTLISAPLTTILSLSSKRLIQIKIPLASKCT